MSDFLGHLQTLVKRGEVIVSRHGLLELAARDILLDDVVAGVAAAIPVEEYPAYVKGPSVLVLQRDNQDRPVHVVWGIAGGTVTPVVLVTAYRPDPARWSMDFLRRRKE